MSEMDRHRFPEKARRAVELVMRQAAYRYGKGASEEEVWGIAGMLHDADYEKWPEDHPNRIVAWLRDRGEGRIAYAVSAHYTQWNVPYESPLDRALLACDELVGGRLYETLCSTNPIENLQGLLKKWPGT